MADVVMPIVRGNNGHIRFPHWLPREYKQAINDWLHTIRNDSYGPRCQELLQNSFMHDFWKKWVASAKGSATDAVRIGGNLDTELPKHFKTVIKLMVYRGGPLPKEPMAKKLNRRREMADIIRTLRALAREDDHLLDLRASTFVEMAQPQKERAKDAGDTRHRSVLLECTQGITFGMMLDALYNRLKNGDQLDSFDAVKDDWYSPKGSKNSRQRLYLELQLEDLFMPIGGDVTQRNLIAMALTIVTGEQVTATEVGNRQRQRARTRSDP